MSPIISDKEVISSLLQNICTQSEFLLDSALSETKAVSWVCFLVLP